ncbi:Transmembrane protein 41B [Chamberlinius hualienensis]
MKSSLKQDSSRKVNSESMGSTRQAVFVLAAVFASSILLISFVYAKFPQLEPEEVQYFKLPRDINDAKNLGHVLSRYKDRFFYQVIAGTFLIYIFLQTFAIPGSIFLSILSGYLFPFYLALLLVCFCSAVGASFCYMLSFLVGRRVVTKYFPERVKSWAATVNNHRDNLLNYIIFLRITPFLPNWFINISAPIIDVPLFPFFLGTFLGLVYIHFFIKYILNSFN